MSRQSALVKARGLKRALLDHGVPQVSIELQRGRPIGGDRWDTMNVVADMSHHIVSRFSQANLTPGLAGIKKGRSDLGGPLANGYGGWDLCYRVISFGKANHSGKGGPVTVGNVRVPKNNGGIYIWGTEYEGGLRTADWDRELTNPRTGLSMDFREFMGRANAGIQDFFGLSVSAHVEHKTWAPGRKIDRLEYDAAKGRKEIRLAIKLVEDGMPLTQDDIEKVVTALLRAQLDNSLTPETGNTLSLGSILSNDRIRLNRVEEKLDQLIMAVRDLADDSTSPSG